MKSNFALSLSFDGLRLMHRVDGGWHFVGEVALDTPDLAAALGQLRTAVEGLDSAPMATKLLIPNDQIRYLALDTTRAEDEDVVAALDGATPYPVADLVYDYAKGGGRTYVAAVARETLDEAQAFAAEHGFNPVCFAAVPEPFTYVGEAYFGSVAGVEVERDIDAVVVIGEADVTLDAVDSATVADAPEADTPATDLPAQDTAEPDAAETALDEIVGAAPDAVTENAEAESVEETAAPDVPEFEPLDTPPEGPETGELASEEPVVNGVRQPTSPKPEVQEPLFPMRAGSADAPAVEAPAADFALPESAPVTDAPAVAQELGAAPEFAKIPDSPVPMDVEELPLEAPFTAEADAAEDDTPEEETPDNDTPAPVFASLRADRNEGAPTGSAQTPPEPPFGRRAPPALAVPTGQGTDPMPPVTAPSRDDLSAPAVSADAPIIDAPTLAAPDADAAPAITGQAPTALSAEAASSAASLSVEPEQAAVAEPSEQDEKSTAAAALGAATAVTGAVTGAVGGMFASRRMARAEAKAAAPEPEATAPDASSRFTVFGARKRKTKAKPVVGGKPKFLGLILTAILLLLLLAIAAFAAVNDERIARWLGFDSPADTQIAETETPVVAPIEVAAAPAPVFVPTVQEGAQILTPEEAQRIYAATGVWQRAPRIAQTPRTTSLDGLQLAGAATPVVRVPASPLADASSVAGDAVIATPVDPPPPSATFNFGSDGLVVATPEGAPTPDGVLIIAGSPPLNPPTRPGTVAPVITPQDQISAIIPDDATLAPATSATAPDTLTPDAPAGVIVISGRPAIAPPVRSGTPTPAVAPTAALTQTDSGAAPLVNTDDLLVLAGTPPVLPPIRPGTTAPAATPEAPALSAPTPEAEPVAAPAIAAEGLNVIAGSPPILPPARPGTTAPSANASASLDALSADIASALDTTTALAPTTDTARPLVRPETVTRAAAELANSPTLGALTAAQAAAFRPRTRPAGLAPAAPTPPEAEPEPLEVAAQPAAPESLQIAPEIAAAVQAAANRPNPIVNPTAQAVAQSSRPDTRPRNMERIVARAQAAQQRAAQQAATQVAAVAPRTVAPSGPTGGSVAQNATLENAINLRNVNLIGIYGGSGDRRALVRLGNGRFLRLTVGDRLDGGRVTAISADALSYSKSGRAITLEVPG